MKFETLPARGWRARAAEPRPAIAISPALRRAASVLAGGAAAALIWTAANDWASAAALLNRLEAIHALFGAGLLAILLYAGLTVVSTVASGILAVAELAPSLVLGGALVGTLPFAQATDPAAAKPASDDAKSVARSEMQIGVYLGGSISPPSDVKLKAPDDTDLTLKDVKWKTESLKPAIYYGMRGIDWNSKVPTLGAMVDFTHAKATAIRTQTVAQTGKRAGKEVPPREPITATFRKLEFTHGLNFITLNGVYRAAGLHRRIIPYAGLGIGFMIPHAEAWRPHIAKKDRVHEAQVTGAAYQIFGGIEWRIFRSDRYSALTEYKLTYAMNDVKLKEGGVVTANIWVHQFNVGGYYTPWRQGAGAAAK